MSDTLKMVLSGMGALIALYLLVRYGDGFAKLVQSTGSEVVTETHALQGR
jgi:pimeloyl-ACP methyl ester carboxylesterase